MKAIILTKQQWGSILQKIASQHPPSVWMSRSKMKQVLGFTPRDHRDPDSDDRCQYKTIHLDFYDEAKRTMFLLKYSDYI